MMRRERAVIRPDRPGSEAAGPESVRPGVSRGELRLPALVLGLIALTCVFLRVVPGDPALQALLTRPFRPNDAVIREREFAILRLKDPPIGTTLPVPVDGRDTAIRSSLGQPGAQRAGARAPQGTIVLMLGACSRCSLSAMYSVDGFQKRHPQFAAVVVSPSPREAAEQFRLENHLGVRIVSDPGGRLARRYNAAWTPRAYLLSRSGALVWCQPDWRVELSGTLSEMVPGGIR